MTTDDTPLPGPFDPADRHYDRATKPIDLERWSELMEDDDYRQVNATVVGPYRVSTVWLGLHDNFGEGLPLIFETMVFETKLSAGELLGRKYEYHEALDELTERYTTEAQARNGHKIIVERVTFIVEGI